ncbi:MAG: MBL fold metallo-hydrolase [Candidatus Coatesbacteria bacterium]|nr:MBL fold metallo-hydrolase [Candidatus Coatesbacteria bacterium]
MRICVLASGSSGNCTLLESGGARVLLDVGLSWVRVERALLSVDVDPTSINAIVVTHEHSDHCKGVGVAARKLKCPVHVNVETLGFIASKLENVGRRQIVLTKAGESFMIEDLEFTPFPVPHDAVNPVGYVVRTNGLKVGVATDLGYPTSVVKHSLKGCRALVLESNHDREMLLNGPYPFDLKQRIASKRGHLSNDQSADLLSEVIHDALEVVLLSHISQENNTRELAFSVAAKTLNELNRQDVTIAMTYQDRPSDLVSIE